MRGLVVGVLALVLAGSGAGAAAPGRVYGVVLVDPGYPVCAAGNPCTRPAARVLLAFSRRSRVVRLVRTSGEGAYSARLPAGVYTVRPRPASPLGRGLEPRRIGVRAGRARRVDFRLDLGIR